MITPVQLTGYVTGKPEFYKNECGEEFVILEFNVDGGVLPIVISRYLVPKTLGIKYQLTGYLTCEIYHHKLFTYFKVLNIEETKKPVKTSISIQGKVNILKPFNITKKGETKLFFRLFFEQNGVKKVIHVVAKERLARKFKDLKNGDKISVKGNIIKRGCIIIDATRIKEVYR